MWCSYDLGTVMERKRGLYQLEDSLRVDGVYYGWPIFEHVTILGEKLLEIAGEFFVFSACLVISRRS